MSRRHSVKALYQVDLIAALFSGFIVVWLTTASDADLYADESPTYISIEIIRHFPARTGALARATTWVPAAALRYGCAPFVTVKTIIEGSPLAFGSKRMPCISTQISNSNTPFSAVREELNKTQKNHLDANIIIAASFEGADTLITIPSEWQVQFEGTILTSWSPPFSPLGRVTSNSETITDVDRVWGETALASMRDPSPLLGKANIVLPHSSLGQTTSARESIRGVIANDPRQFEEMQDGSVVGYSLFLPLTRLSIPTIPDTDTVQICVLDDPVVCYRGTAASTDDKLILARQRP